MNIRARSMVLCVAAVTVLAGCSSGSSGGGPSGSKTIGLAIADQTSEFFIAAADGVQAYAKSQGYTVKVQSADDDSTKQVSQVQTLLTQQIGALIYVPAGAAAASVPVTAANRANVPVVTIDRQPSADSKLVSYIATDSVKASNQLCSQLIERIHGTGEIGIIQGQIGTTPEEARQQGCAQVLAQHPNVKVVAQQSANWDQNKGYQVAQNMLSAHPNMVGIFGQSDAMALGAVKAAKDAGRLQKMTIVGIDGFPDMFRSIQSGEAFATMAQQPYAMGQLAAKDAILAMQGKTKGIPRTQYLPAPLVTSTNEAAVAARKYYGPLGP
jgi:ribose transport system substrate-binding protein